jgi:hypothetical protein
MTFDYTLKKAVYKTHTEMGIQATRYAEEKEKEEAKRENG